MIRKIKWLLEDPVLTYHTVAKGLSVFGLGLISEYQVVLINETREVHECTTTTTVKEYKEVIKIKIEVPTDSDEFVIQLKAFVNLLYALFRSVYPLYLQVNKVIKALNAYKRNALKAISFETKTSILWILVLQTCHFTAGNSTTLAEFKLMLEKLTAKDSHIRHAEVPV